MARTVQILLEVNDRGTAKVRKFGKVVETTSARAARKSARSFDVMATRMGASIDRVTAKTLKWGGLIGIVFGGLAVRAVIKFGAEFEASMSGVSAVTSATGAEMEKLTGIARTLGATTAFSAIEAATAMEELGKAGFSVAEITAVMPDVLNLAGAGMLEMSEAASITSDLMRSLGIDLIDFGMATDILAKTAISSKTTISELGFAFQDAAPVARSLGIDLAQLSGLLGTLANRGFTATRAGTALRRIFSVFLGNVEEGEKGLAGMGLELKHNADGTLDFANILEQFAEKGVDANAIMEAFGLRGGPAMLQIVSAGASELRKFTEALEGAGGTAAEVFAERFNNLRGMTKQLTSALQETALVLFDAIAPALKAAVEGATELVRAWSANLAVSDVVGGLAKVAKVAKIAMVALGISVGAGLVRKLALLLTWTMRNVLGFNAMQMSAARLTSAVQLFGKATIAAKAGVIGLVAGVGLLAYHATRTFLEVTGLDGAIQNFIIRSGDLAKSSNDANIVAANFNNLAKGVERLDEVGLEINFPEDIQKALRETTRIMEASPAQLARELGWKIEPEWEQDKVDRFVALWRDALTIKAQADVELGDAEMIALVGAVQLIQKRVKTLSDEDLPIFAEAFNKAGEAGKKGIDQIKFGLAELDRVQADSNDAAVDKAKARAEIVKQGAKALEAAFKSAGFASTKMGEALADDLGAAIIVAGEQGISADKVYLAFQGTIEETILALQSAAQEIPAPLRAAVEELERIQERADELLREMGGHEPIEEPPPDFAPEAFPEMDIAGLSKFDTPEEGILEPPDPSAWEDYFQTLADAGEGFVDNIGVAWAGFTEGAIDQVGSMVGAMATGAVSLQEGLSRLLKGLAAQAIKMLVQWGIQRLIVNKLAASGTVAAGAAGVGTETARAYMAAFASISAIPIIGPALAAASVPAIIATQLGLASAAGAQGAGIGAGLGMIGFAGGAEGGIITGRMAGIVEMGERGDELIAPLRGLAARRAADALGLTDILDGQASLQRELGRNEGGGSTTIRADLHFHGDNWRDGGVASELGEQVHASLAQLIETGQRAPLPVGRI